MLRECHRVLKTGGRIAGYVIHTPRGLSPRDELRASELGPSEVGSDESTEQLARSASLSVVALEDVTAEFFDTCQAIVRARENHEDALRTEEGHEAYEEEQADKQSMLHGIEEGLLQRSLVVAVKP